MLKRLIGLETQLKKVLFHVMYSYLLYFAFDFGVKSDITLSIFMVSYWGPIHSICLPGPHKLLLQRYAMFALTFGSRQYVTFMTTLGLK